MSSINKATPRAKFDGFKDESARALPVVLEQIPIHLPYLHLQTRKGPLTPQLVSGKDMLVMYGAESFDEASKYYSHQTMASNICNGYGNAIFIKRMVDASAKRARVVVKCEMVETEVEKYTRDATGAVAVDAQGVKQTQTGVYVTVQKLKWTVEVIPAASPQPAVGNIATVSPGTMTGSAGQESSVYAVMEFECAGLGEYGNGVGFRLSFPSAKATDPADAFVVEDQKTAIFRMQYVERPAPDRSPVVISTLNSQRSIDFSFKKGVVNTKTDQMFDIQRLTSDWNDFTKGQVPRFGPMENVHVYESNMKIILDACKDAENTAAVNVIADSYQLNPFTVVDYKGNDYEGMRLDTATAAFNSATTHYLKGGSDGSVGEPTLDALVKTEVEKTWDNAEYPLLNSQKYPFSALYDTGFGVETKKSILNTLGNRRDFHVTVCTQDVSAKDNNIAAETSVGTLLRAAARLTPESTVHGTEVCRAVIVRGMGPSTRSRYRRNVPLIMDLIAKRARYWGAGEGRAKSAYSYDEAPTNRVTELEDVTNSWVNDTVKDKQWELGINGVQSTGRSDLFWAAYQTVYSDDTSILNSELLMQIMVDVTKRAETVWTQLTGDTKLTKAEFKVKSDDLFKKAVAGRYDGRVVIIGDTNFTATDDVRGFSWTMDIAVYGNNMKTVGQYNIIARRRSDLGK